MSFQGETTLPAVRAETWSMKIAAPIPTPPTVPKPQKVSLAQRSRLQAYAHMPETRLEQMPDSLSFLETHGKSPQVLTSRDMLTNSLRQDMAKLKLGDHFDAFGKPRFQKLGLTFAAKQKLPQANARYSSTAQELNEAVGKEDFQAARAFIIAQEAVADDMKRWKVKAAEFLAAVTEDDKFKDEDVKSRQLDILFLEVEDYERYIPPALPTKSLVPTFDREDEQRSRALAGRAIGFLEERNWVAGLHMSWRSNQSEVQALSEVMKLWSIAAWGPAAGYLGMERSTFCRFILDVGLVDQKKVPYFWAVSLFDQMSRPLRCASLDDPLISATPLSQVANRWEIITVVELLMDQHFKPGDGYLRTRFLQSLLDIAKMKLPASAISQSDLMKQGYYEALLRGESIADKGGPQERPDADARTQRLDKEDKKKQQKEAKAKSGREGERFKREAEAESQKVEQSHVPNPAVSAASAKRMKDEEQSKNQRVRSMLVEPEVLQLLAQHQEIFRLLHKAYADDYGHMTFHGVAQLCTDFCMVPTFCTMHALEKRFESVECVDFVQDLLREALAQSIYEDDEGSSPRSQRGGSTSPRRQSFSAASIARGNSRRFSNASNVSMDRIQEAPAPLTARETRRRSVSGSSELLESPLSARQPRRGSAVLPAASAEKQSRPPSTSSIRGGGRPPSSTSSIRGGSKPQTGRRSGRTGSKSSVARLDSKTSTAKPGSDSRSHAGNPEAEKHVYSGPWPPRFPWDVVHQRARYEEAAGGKDILPRPSIFGYEALMELLCKVGFHHLSFYGNIQQRSMDGLLQTCWLLVFLRHATDSLRQSLDKRGLSQAEEEARFGALSRAVRSMHDDLWNLSAPPVFSGDGTSIPPTTTWRPALFKTPETLGLIPWKFYQDPFHLVGQPCVVNGVCGVCNTTVANAGWGDSRCFGCSKVDTTAFKRHPLAVLLIDRPPGQRVQAPVAMLGQRIRRASLSPVRLKDCNSLKSLTAKQDWLRI
eukprot:gb/GFBE01009197.1/.p1 GENE.gb/GFBE01009197.1/~~gb/GFBE01009197.1/.p1  ORF type:complete len:993 (+),score=189.57 gb/GFBE01009197.1/:1-2979(+)